MRISDWSSDVCSSDLWRKAGWSAGIGRTHDDQQEERCEENFGQETGAHGVAPRRMLTKTIGSQTICIQRIPRRYACDDVDRYRRDDRTQHLRHHDEGAVPNGQAAASPKHQDRKSVVKGKSVTERENI